MTKQFSSKHPEAIILFGQLYERSKEHSWKKSCWTFAPLATDDKKLIFFRYKMSGMKVDLHTEFCSPSNKRHRDKFDYQSNVCWIYLRSLFPRSLVAFANVATSYTICNFDETNLVSYSSFSFIANGFVETRPVFFFFLTFDKWMEMPGPFWINSNICSPRQWIVMIVL